MKRYRLVKDAYRSVRGGKAELFVLTCRNCHTKLMLYQKDYPTGLLKRLYLDRIVAPTALKHRQRLPLRSVPLLQCANCHHVIGVPYSYPKEKRKAYMVEMASLIKKKSHGTY